MNREVKINPLFASKIDRPQPQKSVQNQVEGDSFKFDSTSGSSTLKSGTHPQTKPLATTAKPKKRKRRKTQKRLKFNNPLKNITIPTPVAWAYRLTIITVGLSTILGSVIAIANSFESDLAANQPTSPVATATITDKSSPLANRFSLLSVGREMIPLKTQIKAIAKRYPQLEAGIIVADITSKEYVNLEGTKTFAAASTIKIPILVAFFQDVDSGKIKLNDPLTLAKDNLAEGSGEMRYQPVGTKYSALETATKMIAVSDNTATNMLIEHLGGQEALNQKFADWGLNSTKISDRLPDKLGTNTTSPEDLGNLLLKIDRGELVSLASRDRIIGIMKQTEKDTLLPQGLGEGAAIAHKTGTLRSILADTGIIYTPNGQRYLAAVLVKRSHNDPQAESFIQEISRTAYQYFLQKSSQPTETSQKLRPFLAE